MYSPILNLNRFYRKSPLLELYNDSGFLFIWSDEVDYNRNVKYGCTSFIIFNEISISLCFDKFTLHSAILNDAVNAFNNYTFDKFLEKILSERFKEIRKF